MRQNIAWIIAGMDTSGGAGIHNDVKTFSDFNVHPCTILTCVASQNNHYVEDIFCLPTTVIRSQLKALMKGFQPHAIKLGLIKNKKMINLIYERIKNLNIPLICDPILTTSSGYHVLDKSELDFYSNNIFKHVTVLTPNILEAEKLVGFSINDEDDIEAAANHLLQKGIKEIIIKGGHAKDYFASDYWTNGEESCSLSFLRLRNKKNVRGTGCAFSSALTACVVNGDKILDAFLKTKCYVHQGIQDAESYDDETYFFKHTPFSFSYLPTIKTKQISFANKFLAIEKIGFYPIVDNLELFSKLISEGIQMIQLRIKNDSSKLEHIIETACQLAKIYNIKIFINDHWQLAIKYGAYGVHLGQEDLIKADLNQIRTSGLRLGVSTHTLSELLKAIRIQPSYIAVGPIYKTATKKNYEPLGHRLIQLWRQVTSIPLIAIGGIQLTNAHEIIATGINGVAVISAIYSKTFWQDLKKWRSFFGSSDVK